MKKTLALAALCMALIPVTSFGAAAKKAMKAAAPTKYECVKCHMIYSAADAKKNHMKDPMDGGKLVPVKAAMKPAPKKMAPMGGMRM